MGKMLLTGVLVITLIFTAIGGQKVATGYYFSFEELARHAIEDFPILNLVPEEGQEALDWATDFLLYGFNLIGWLFSFDPWVKGTPIYRDNEFPWNGGVTTV